MYEAATATATAAATSPGNDDEFGGSNTCRSAIDIGSNPESNSDSERKVINPRLHDGSQALLPVEDQKQQSRQETSGQVCDEHTSLSGKMAAVSDQTADFSREVNEEDYWRIAEGSSGAVGTASVNQPNKAAAISQGDSRSRTSRSVYSASSRAMSYPGAFAQGGIQSQGDSSVSSEAESNDDASTPSLDGSAMDDNHEGLVEARPVLDDTDGPPDDMPQATPVEGTTTSTKLRSEANHKLSTTQKILLMSWVLCLVVGAVVVVVISVTKKDASVDSSPSPVGEHGNRTVTAEDYLRQYLPEETLQDLDDTASPQYQAFQWLKEDPTLTEYSNTRLLQRYALSTFYFSTNGPLWINSKNWLSYEVHECEWYFAGSFKIFGPELTAASPCINSNATLALEEEHAPEDTYKRLWLRDNNIKGPVPRELYWLVSLESIDFSRNNVTGRIDSDRIQELRQLKHLSFPVNQLTGPIPRGLGALSNTLEILYLSRNAMTGPLPLELSYLQHSLKQLTLQGNGFSGTLPIYLGLMGQLNVLGIQDMPYITGMIPTEMGMMANLMYLYAFNSHLTGTIPTEVGLMSNLLWLHLQSNLLDGSIPSALGLLAPTLKELVLNDNQLSSSLPTELGLLGIQTFNVAQNDLSGTIPSEYALLSVVSTFNVSGNVGLHGSIPDDLCFLDDIQLGFDCSEELCGCDCQCLD